VSSQALLIGLALVVILSIVARLFGGWASIPVIVPLLAIGVIADEGAIGDQTLKAFQDNEKTIPTILTTSKKLSTGVNARNIRNIILLRPIKSMIEFKQIIGRGTRLYEGKDYFTVYDFVDFQKHLYKPAF